MGFFSGGGIGGLLGGGTRGTTTPMTSGFAQAPAQVQDVYKNYADLLKTLKVTPEMFMPQALTGAESGAVANINKGFTPDAALLSSDISMQTNPYDKYVIDEINRQSGGDYSLLKQSLNEAGQMGSNRQNLGANDIDLSRLNQIGGFKRDAYQTALQNALTTLPGLRTKDAANQLSAGEFLRGLDLQTKQAPVAAAGAQGDLLSALNAVLQASQPVQSGTAGTKGNALTGIGNIAQIASMFAGSDMEIKENIIPIGIENGHNIYEFSYKGKPARYVGVMAQEVEKTHPLAVIRTVNGMKVNYSMIGVKMRRVA